MFKIREEKHNELIVILPNGSPAILIYKMKIALRAPQVKIIYQYPPDRMILKKYLRVPGEIFIIKIQTRRPGENNGKGLAEVPALMFCQL